MSDVCVMQFMVLNINFVDQVKDCIVQESAAITSYSDKEINGKHHGCS